MHFWSFIIETYVNIKLVNVDYYVLKNAESGPIFVLYYWLNNERGPFIIICLTIDSKLTVSIISKSWGLRRLLNLKMSFSFIRICHLKFGESSFNNKVSLNTPKRKGFILSWLRNNIHWKIFCNNKLINLSRLKSDFQRCPDKFSLSVKVRVYQRFYMNSIGILFRKSVSLKTHDHFLRAITTRCDIKL